MITVEQFHAIAMTGERTCTQVVRELFRHDAGLWRAMEPPEDAWPIDLLTVAEARARAVGIMRIDPATDRPAVGFFPYGSSYACAANIPGAGWWARGRRGIVPIPAHRIVAAYEVRECLK